MTTDAFRGGLCVREDSKCGYFRWDHGRATCMWPCHLGLNPVRIPKLKFCPAEGPPETKPTKREKHAQQRLF